MSTRSRIAIVENDGSVTSIYCHWDGYPSNNGKILLENYKDEAKVRKLIALGDISSLGAETEPPEGEKHTYGEPLDGVTVAYHRDRGEVFSNRRDESVQALARDGKGGWEEYVYVFECGKWLYNAFGAFCADGKGELKPLDENAVKED